MSSRQEEKERRKQERLAREQEIEKAERRRRLLGLFAGGVLGAAAIAAVVVAVLASGGGSDDPKPNVNDGPRVPIPAQKATDLEDAAKDAGCTYRTFTPGANDREHVNGTVSYKHNPPVFGPHAPTPSSDGNYAGQGPVDREPLVHALEHGRLVIWYQSDLPKRRISQLETLFDEPIEGQPSGYKQLLVEAPDIPGQVAASGWGHQLNCPRMTDKTFDALRTFRATAVDKGPETVPFGQ
ncbi:MAG TPA: DUF3105 domain-containing protein [Solirubrobacteraceae bacterium]|nr:DUF3105 domain-containing protein [Solirubrobacteraceae bacterium]